MNETISITTAAYLMILWFFAGRQLGHVGAKYARAKRSSKIVMAVFILLALGVTMYVAWHKAG